MNYLGPLSLLVAVALMQPPALEASPTQPASPIDQILSGAEAGAAADRPAFVTDAEVRPEGPLSERDAANQNRLLSAFQSAQGRQGAFDGRWTVFTPQGTELFVLQLTDPGAGEGRIEGAWRNPRRPGALSSGFIDAVVRDGAFTVFRFVEKDPDQPTEVRLQAAEGGDFVGEAGGEAVVMRRTGTVELQALAAPQLAPAPKAPAARAKARPAPKRGKATKSRPRAAQPRAGAKKK